MKTIIELRRERAALIEQCKTMLATADKEKRALTEDEDGAYAGLEKQVEALGKEIDRRERLEGYAVETPQHQRGASGPAFHQRSTRDTAASLMCRYIRSRGRDFTAAEEMGQAAREEYRAADAIAYTELELGMSEERASNDTIMNIATAADGGNLVPTGHYNRIIARRDEAGLAAVLPIMPIPGVGTTVNVPTDDEADGEFVTKSEQDDAHDQTFDRDAPAVGKAAMTLVKYTKKIELTDELLMDNDSNLMAHLEFRVGVGLRKTDNNLIVTEALANGTAALTLDSATAIGATEVPELIYKQADGYEEGSAFIMRRATLGAIMGLVGENFQFVPTPIGGSRSALWGFPAHTTSKAAASAASAKSMIFGNFQYMGVRRMPGLTILVDPYTVDGMVVLKYYYRVVFKVLQAAAIIYATHPTG